MTLDEYNEAVKQIMTEQQAIAQSTAQLAMTGSAHPANTQFTALIGKQWALVQRLTQLNSELMMGIFTPKG